MSTQAAVFSRRRSRDGPRRSDGAGEGAGRRWSGLLDGEALLLRVADEVVLPRLEGADDVPLVGDRLADGLLAGRVGVVHERQPPEVLGDGRRDLGEELVDLLAAV